tara:strand:+ start:1924 stop:3423 length:1500 start_codon:yes stop_codon:yes gene_type:complete
MQPFPTSFWKGPAYSEEVLPEESFQFINVEEDDSTSSTVDNYYLANSPDTSSPGLYMDYNYDSLSELRIQDYPAFIANRNELGGPLNLNDVTLVKFGDLMKDETSEEGPLQHNVKEGPYLTKQGYIDTMSMMQRHFTYVWMNGGETKSTVHKTHPITMSLSNGGKTAGVKCYFEKDIFQKLVEIENASNISNFNFGAGYSLLSEESQSVLEDDKYDAVYSAEDLGTIRNLAKQGYNGYFTADLDTAGFTGQLLWRQKAKVRIKFVLNATKNLQIKIKGLGSDENTGVGAGLGGGAFQHDFLQKYFEYPEVAFGQDKYDEETEYASDKLDADTAPAYGDRQSCKIILNGEEKIKAIAPNMGIYQYNDSVTYADNHARGPVRIFEKINDKYHGTGGDLGFGTSSTRGVDYHFAHGLEYLNFAPSTYLQSYGSYVPGAVNFYDHESITTTTISNNTPSYSSPYQYTETISLEAGDHEIDIEFDSVFMVNNGGSYYELEFNIT